MISARDYVAGWLDSSINEFLKAVPADALSVKYALVTCLDSNLEPKSLLRKSSNIWGLSKEFRPLGKALLVPTAALVSANLKSRLFFGFDEVWFFPNDKITPKPPSAWLVGPARIAQEKLDRLDAWMSDNSCSLALGDGEGLNFIIKARGLVKHVLGHSIEQQQPADAFAASDAALAG
jgi:hypothetical protein